MRVTSNTKGQLAVSRAELRAVELGYIPSRPLYDTRYDLIVDDGKKLQRVQVKYADGKPSNSAGAVVVKLDYENRQKASKTYTLEEVDALVVYIPKIDRLCYLPPNLFVGKRKINIRIQNSKSNQIRRTIQASQYYW